MFIPFLILLSLVSANVSTNIDMKESYNLGEEILINYTLTSDRDTQANIAINIDCPSASVPLIAEKTITLIKNTPYKDVYHGMVVQDFFEPQTCTAYIRFREPIEKTVSKTFVINTNPSFSFNLKTCKDKSCLEKAKTFIKGSTIYLDYDVGVSTPSVIAKLTYPNKHTKEISLPASLRAKQVGTYNLEATASKEGYKTIKNREQFAVIGKETLQANLKNWLLIIGILIIFVGIVIFLIKLINKKQKIENKGFTLMEVIISMGVITTALVVCIALITFSIGAVRTNKSKLIAINLAEEGLEIVRNIRDSNWLAYKRTADTWRDGLDEGDWQVQYDDSELLSSNDDNLLIDDDGFYQYATGSYTPFKRTITITHIDDNQIKVETEIDWQERGRNYTYKVEDRLYNWLEESEEE